MAKKYTPQLWDIITLKDGTIINIDTEEKLKIVTERVKSNYKWFKESTESIRNEPIKIPTQDTSWISMDSEVDNKPLSPKDKAKQIMDSKAAKVRQQNEYANAKWQVEDIYSWTKYRWIVFWDSLVDQDKQIILYNDNKQKLDAFNDQIKLNVEEQKRINEEINTAKDAAKKARAEKKLAKLAEEKNKLIEDAKKLTDEHLKKYWSVLDNNVDIDKERIKKSLEDIDKFNKNINQDTSWISMDSEIPKDQEYEKFIKGEKVSNQRLEEIANKIKTWAKVTKEDLAIQTWYKNEIENLLKWNVTSNKKSPFKNKYLPDWLLEEEDSIGTEQWNKTLKLQADDIIDTTKKWASSVDDILNAIPKEEIEAANNAIKSWSSSEIKESISWISKILNKIPWWTKILAAAKLAWKVAWPVWIVTSLYSWLKDVRTDLIKDEEKTWLQNFVQNLWRTLPDLAVKTVINSVNDVTDLWSYIIWNTVWWAVDLLDLWWQLATWDKKSLEESKKRNFSKDMTEALNKSWDQTAATAKAWFDKFNYWVDKDVDFDKSYEKYMKEQWRDSSWILLEVEDEKPVTTQVENKQQQNIVNRTSDTNQWTQQWRRLFKLKDGSFWYLSQWWENEWKLVRWFKTLDEAKNAVNQWVKWFHLWNIKNELSKVNTTDKSAVENVLTKYIKEKWINPSNAKDKWITDEWLKEIWISF